MVHFMIRYGAKPLPLDKSGSTSVEAGGLDALPGVIDTVLVAVRAGELDVQLAAAAQERRSAGAQERRSAAKRSSAGPAQRRLPDDHVQLLQRGRLTIAGSYITRRRLLQQLAALLLGTQMPRQKISGRLLPNLVISRD